MIRDSHIKNLPDIFYSLDQDLITRYASRSRRVSSGVLQGFTSRIDHAADRTNQLAYLGCADCTQAPSFVVDLHVPNCGDLFRLGDAILVEDAECTLVEGDAAAQARATVEMPIMRKQFGAGLAAMLDGNAAFVEKQLRLAT